MELTNVMQPLYKIICYFPNMLAFSYRDAMPLNRLIFFCVMTYENVGSILITCNCRNDRYFAFSQPKIRSQISTNSSQSWCRFNLTAVYFQPFLNLWIFLRISCTVLCNFYTSLFTKHDNFSVNLFTLLCKRL